ncbi:MAG: hypothetical protein ACRC62_15585 [Microcoleus sp.]
MPLLKTTENFGDTFPPVLATSEGMRSPAMIDIDTSFYDATKTFPPGFFAGTTPVADKYRILPRTKITALPGSNTLVVTPFTAGIFRVGEVITAVDATTGAVGGAVGTIQSIDHVANRIVLVTTPGAGALIGNTVGVQASAPVMANGNRMGVISPNTAIDFSLRSNSQFGCFLSATLYRSRMPYIDKYLEGLYPELNFV